MKISNVIRTIERRVEFLTFKLLNWDGPLHMGTHGYYNQEKVALETAIKVLKVEHEKRLLDQMEMRSRKELIEEHP